MFMHRFWRNFRLGLLILMFIGSGFYVLATTPWSKYFGPRPNYTPIIAEGRPIVDAIYRFKADRGLWPEYLDDLAPAYLPKAPAPQWYYQRLSGGPSLARVGRGDDLRVGYDFDPVQPVWRVISDDEDRVLEKCRPPGLAGPPRDKLIANELAELDRRIRADHDAMEHYRAKASFLKSLGRLGETRQVVTQAQAADPDHFWPRVAVVALDLAESAGTQQAPEKSAIHAAPAVPPSLQDFDRWVQVQPTFTNLYYLSLAYRLAGDDKKAMELVERDAKLPPVAAGNDMERTAFYSWDMTRFAIRAARWDLVIELTDNWEKAQIDHPHNDESFYALRAAAKLVTGDLDGARHDMHELDVDKVATWAQSRDALQKAVDSGDKSFHYDPGDSPPPFPIFAVPE